MFGKKKLPGIPVQHYEGLDFAKDYPCRISFDNQDFKIVRIKPETTVTLPAAQIRSFTAMEEENYMLKYHGEKISTSKAPIKKYYLIVEYTSKAGENKHLAFWGTAAEYGKFIDLQHTDLHQSTSYTL